jgi:hypothetical protein
MKCHALHPFDIAFTTRFEKWSEFDYKAKLIPMDIDFSAHLQLSRNKKLPYPVVFQVRSSSRRTATCGNLPFDQEDYPIAVANGVLYSISGFANEIGNVDCSQRIGAMDFKPIARLDSTQCLARLQRRQGTFQSHQVKFCRCHGRNLSPSFGKASPNSLTTPKSLLSRTQSRLE